MLELALTRCLGSLACTLLAAGSFAYGADFIAHLFDSFRSLIDVSSVFPERERQLVWESIRRLRRQIARDSHSWLSAELGPNWETRSDAGSALLALEVILPSCLPDAADVVKANLDTKAIVTLVARKAVTIDAQFSADQLGGQILTILLTRCYELLKNDWHFVKLLQLPILQELLVRTSSQSVVSLGVV